MTKARRRVLRSGLSLATLVIFEVRLSLFCRLNTNTLGYHTDVARLKLDIVGPSAYKKDHS